MPTPEDQTQESAPAPASEQQPSPYDKLSSKDREALAEAWSGAGVIQRGMAEANQKIPSAEFIRETVAHMEQLKGAGYEVSEQEIGALKAVLAAREALDANLDTIYGFINRTREDRNKAEGR
jgi:hypothetical protein